MNLGLAAYINGSAWLVPLCPFVAFLLILMTIRNRWLSGMISITGILLSTFASSIILWFRVANHHYNIYDRSVEWITIGKTTLYVGTYINNLSAEMMFVVSFVALLIQIYSWGYMENEEETGFSKYYAYMSLFAASMLGLVLSPNFFQMYIFWELVGLCSYLLIGFWYKKKSASEAAKKAFVVTRFGDLGFLMGIILLYTLTGTFSFQAIPAALTKLLQTTPMLTTLIPGYFVNTQVFVNVVIFLVFCGAIGKSAMFPLHVWLPDAMEGPTPVSALIHAATMVAAGVYMVAQTMDIFKHAPDTMIFIAIIGGATAFIAASMGVVQDDIKRVLAYSTISQLGYMMLALGVGGFAAGVIHQGHVVYGSQSIAEIQHHLGISEDAGYIAGTFHLMTHAFFKALLFLCAGSAIHALHTNNIWEMGRLSRYMGKTSFAFLCGTLALAGIFPFSGFWSKDEILATVSHGGVDPFWFFRLIGYIVVFLTAFYMFRVYYVAFYSKSRERFTHTPHESPTVMTAPLIILAVFAFGLGFIGTPWNNMFAEFITGGRPPEHEVNLLLMIFPFSVSALGWAAAYGLYGKDAEKGEEVLKSYKTLYKILINKYYMDDFWDFILRKIVYTFGRIMSFIDEKIIDGLVNTAGWLSDEFGHLIRREETGQVQHYAVIIIFSFVILILGLAILGHSMSQFIVSHFHGLFN